MRDALSRQQHDDGDFRGASPSGVRPCLFQPSSADDAHECCIMNVTPGAVERADHCVPSRQTFNLLTMTSWWRVRRPPPVRRCHPPAPEGILPPRRAHGRVPRAALTGPHHQARGRTRVRTSDTSTKRAADLFAACLLPAMYVCGVAALASALPGSSARRVVAVHPGSPPRWWPLGPRCERCSGQRPPSRGRGGRGRTLRDG